MNDASSFASSTNSLKPLCTVWNKWMYNNRPYLHYRPAVLDVYLARGVKRVCLEGTLIYTCSKRLIFFQNNENVNLKYWEQVMVIFIIFAISSNLSLWSGWIWAILGKKDYLFYLFEKAMSMQKRKNYETVRQRIIVPYASFQLTLKYFVSS